MNGRGAGLGATTRKPQRDYIHPAEHMRAFEAEVFERMGAKLPDITPGQLVRFDDPDKPLGNRCCWAVFYVDGCPAGAFGNWRTGERHTWRADGKPPTREDREQNRRVIEAVKRKRAQEAKKRHQAAAATARDMWARARPATIEHPYLQRKHVPALGLRVLERELLVPLTDINGTLHSLQRIAPDGRKRYLAGGRVKACFWRLGEIPERGELFIVEGMATAGTVAMDTRTPTLAAMSAGNLTPVAEAVRARYPLVSINIGADCDHKTPGNPGLRLALEAARAVDGAVTWPQLCGRTGCKCTDFNDAANCEVQA